MALQSQSLPQDTMSIAASDIETLKPYILQWISEANIEINTTPSQSRNLYDRDLLERSVRIEEELKSQREIIQQGFSYMEKRFEQIDKKIDLQREELNQKIDLQREELNQKIDLLREEMNRRFELVEQRFEQVDKRFEQVDKRFEQVDQRFEKLFQNFRWSVGIAIAFWTASIAALPYIL